MPGPDKPTLDQRCLQPILILEQMFQDYLLNNSVL